MVEDKEKSTAVPAVGDVVEGTVEHLAAYGAFVRLGTGQKAMIHISELSRSYVQKVEDVLTVGEKVSAKVIKIDEKGRIDLSLKVLQSPSEAVSSPTPIATPSLRARQERTPSPDDFEKRLSNFLKRSEEKFTEISAKNKGRSGSRRRGGGARG